jgi:hypothetical protein
MYDVTPISEDHSDIFTPLSDTAVGMSGEMPDVNQSDPEQGSVVELGGVDTDEDTFSISRGAVPIATGTYSVVSRDLPVNVPSTTTQNLSGQSSSPPAVNGTLPSTSGAGPAAPTVPLNNTDEGTEDVSAVYETQGPSLATASLGSRASNVLESEFSLLQTGDSGLSLGANLILYFVLGVAIAIVSTSLIKEF